MIAWRKRQILREQERREQKRLRDEFAKAWIAGAAGDPTTRSWTSKAADYGRTAYAVADGAMKARSA